MEILHGVSVRLDEGEIVAILGPNGAGKSTLIKTIFGLLRPTRGRVWLRGQEITGLPPEELVALGIGYVPQVGNVFPSLTVRENLEMAGYPLTRGAPDGLDLAGRIRRILRNPGRKEIDRRIQEVLRVFPDLASRVRARVGDLSGGQQQMVALAKSLVLGPRVLLIDEPSAGLAPKLVEAVFEKLQEIRDQGTSLVVVEQRARRILALADRAYILDTGRNRFEDRGEALLRNPEIGRLYLGG